MTNEDRLETRGQRNQSANQVFGDAEQFASGVFDSSILGLAILDNRLRYLAVNDAFAGIDGIPAREHQGKTVREVLGHAALTIESALNRVLATGLRVSSLEVTATLPTRDAPGHFMMNLFPIKDAAGVTAKIVAMIVEVTRLREFEKCLTGLIGHLPRVRDQIICLALPNREENDKIQSWRGSIEMLDTCVQRIYRLADMLRPPALLSTIAPLEPHQVSLLYFSPMAPKENSRQSSGPSPSQDNGYNQLPPRQLETLRLLAHGKSNKEIAAALGISPRTVDHYRERIMLKLDLHSVSDIVHYAVQHGLIQA
jgi:DNA-binding CsgD family transcriptional regulator